MKLAAYCRVSTDREAQLESLENQKAFFAEFAAKQGHELVQVYADEGLSGKQAGNRRAFLQMLADAEQGLFEMVVVKDVSRFARNTVDFLCATRRLRSLQIEVQFLSNNQTVLGSSEFVLTVFSALAQEESANLSKRVRFGKRVNARRGRVPNLIYGYDQLDTFTLAVNPQESQVVRRMFLLYQDQGLGAHRIALVLNEEGIPGKKGGRWDAKTVRRMLRNPIYCGKLVNNKYETADFLTGKQVRLPPDQQFVHDRPEYAIISQELFEQVQRTADERAQRYAAHSRHSTSRLFSNLIWCAECGRAFTRRNYTCQSPSYKWSCSSHARSSACCPNRISIDESELCGALQAYLDRQVADRDAFFRRAAQAYRGALGHSGTAGREKQLEQIERRRERYKTMYANGLIELGELKARCTRLDDERERLLRWERQADDPESRIQALCLPDSWTNAGLRELVERITAFPGGRVEIEIKPLFRGASPCG